MRPSDFDYDDPRADGFFPFASASSDVEYSDSAGLVVNPQGEEGAVVLRVTSATATSGLYPARLEDWDDAAAAPRLADASAADDCWAQGANSEALTTKRYGGIFLGYHSDGLPVYDAVELGTLALTASQNISNPTQFYSQPVSNIMFSAIGFGATYSAGVLTVNDFAASATTSGYVSAAAQTFAGAKTFNNTVTVYAPSNYYASLGVSGSGYLIQFHDIVNSWNSYLQVSPGSTASSLNFLHGTTSGTVVFGADGTSLTWWGHRGVTGPATLGVCGQVDGGLVTSALGGSPAAPTGTTDTGGSVGEVRFDGSWLYIKTGITNGWRRVALGTW